jgi:hypothetical protein
VRNLRIRAEENTKRYDSNAQFLHSGRGQGGVEHTWGEGGGRGRYECTQDVIIWCPDRCLKQTLQMLAVSNSRNQWTTLACSGSKRVPRKSRENTTENMSPPCHKRGGGRKGEREREGGGKGGELRFSMVSQICHVVPSHDCTSHICL